MAENNEEAVGRINELLTRAEGFMTDAEFREEMDMKNLRYQQAMSHTLLAMSEQNRLILDLLRKQVGEE